jgi:hypothetical protein
MDPVWRHRESNPSFANIPKRSESTLGKKGYKKGMGSLSWVRKCIWPFIGLIMGVTLIVLFYPITLHNFIIGIITGAFSGVIAQIIIDIQK